MIIFLNSFKGLRKYFGKKKIVNDVYLDVKRGEIFGLLGPNGAGKTTALNVMTADYRATAGEVIPSSAYFIIFCFSKPTMLDTAVGKNLYVSGIHVKSYMLVHVTLIVEI